MRMMKTTIVTTVCLLMLAFGSTHSAMVLVSMSLEKTVREAGRVLCAKVLDVRTGEDSDGLPATWVTIAVKRSLKGGAESRIEIKQFGQASGASGKFSVQVPHVPQYTVDEELVLFLRHESARGFTSPVGFENGVYRVRLEEGRRVARTRNGQEGTALDRLLSEIERIVAGSK